MNTKEFLKPDWKKGLITAILIIISLLFVYALDRIAIVDFYTIGRGWPLPYFIINIGGGVAQGFSMFYWGLIIDLIFWYLLSCFILSVYDRIKQKN